MLVAFAAAIVVVYVCFSLFHKQQTEVHLEREEISVSTAANNAAVWCDVSLKTKLKVLQSYLEPYNDAITATGRVMREAQKDNSFVAPRDNGKHLYAKDEGYFEALEAFPHVRTLFFKMDLCDMRQLFPAKYYTATGKRLQNNQLETIPQLRSKLPSRPQPGHLQCTSAAVPYIATGVACELQNGDSQRNMDLSACGF
jgi:hypothetical protein